MRERLKRLWWSWGHIDSFRGLVEAIWQVVSLVGSFVGVALIAVAFISAGAGWVSDQWVVIVTGLGLVIALTPWVIDAIFPRQAQPDLASWPLVDGDIVLVDPRNGSTVTSPVRFRGYAQTFEGNVVISKLRNNEWETAAITTAGMDEVFVAFAVDIEFELGEHQLRIGDFSPKDGEWSGVELGIEVASTAPRYVGAGMMKVMIEGLSAPGEFTEVPIDIVDAVQDIQRRQGAGEHVKAGDFQGESKLGLEMSTVLSMAIADDYLTISRDGEQYLDVVLTAKGEQLIQAVEKGPIDVS